MHSFLPFYFDLGIPLVFLRFCHIFNVIVNLSNHILVAQQVVAHERQDFRLVRRIQAQKRFLLDLQRQHVRLRLLHQPIVLLHLLGLKRVPVFGVRLWWGEPMQRPHLSLGACKEVDA